MTMMLGAVSLCLAILVLNAHYRKKYLPIPYWVRVFILKYIATVLCMQVNQLDKASVRAEELKHETICREVLHKEQPSSQAYSMEENVELPSTHK